MAGAFKNTCSICGKPFNEQDKAVVTAMVVVTTGGHSSPARMGKPISPKDKVQIRFRSGSKRELAHLSCALIHGAGEVNG
jgi:hypothetical protein